MSNFYRESSSGPDIVHIGGGGGVPYMLASLGEQNPGLVQASIVNSTDNGGHTGRLRRDFPGDPESGMHGISSAGDAVKAVGALATEEGYDLATIKERDASGGSVGNGLFLEHYLEAVAKGEDDPNQAALDALVEAAGSAPVYFATEPANITMSKGVNLAGGESEIADYLAANHATPEEILTRQFEVVSVDGEEPVELLSRPLGAVITADHIMLSPSHPISSTSSTTIPLRRAAGIDIDAISAKTTLVIGTENPWNMPGFTAADHYRFLQQTSGISPANVVIGQSGIEIGELPDEVQRLIELTGYYNIPRSAETGNPLESHKPTEIYPPKFALKALEEISRKTAIV